MANLQKITQGITGQEAADIIYNNDTALQADIRTSFLNNTIDEQNKLFSLHYTSRSAEYFNGGVISQDLRKFTIPEGQTGRATYVQVLFTNATLLKPNTTGRIFIGYTVILSDPTRINDIEFDGYFSPQLSFTKVVSVSPSQTNDNQFYITIEVRTPLPENLTNIRVFAQMKNSAAVSTSDFSVELTDAVLYLSGNSELAYQIRQQLFENEVNNVTQYLNPEIGKDPKLIRNALDYTLFGHAYLGTIIDDNKAVYINGIRTDYYSAAFGAVIANNASLANVKTGDKIYFHLAYREKKNPTYNLAKLSSSAFFTWHNMYGTQQAVNYFYNTASNELNKTLYGEDDLYNYYYIDGNITITQAIEDAIEGGTFAYARIVFLDAVHRTDIVGPYEAVAYNWAIGYSSNSYQIHEYYREAFKELRNYCNALSEKIGIPYNTNDPDAGRGAIADVTTGIRISKGYTVAEGINENGNSLYVTLACKRYKDTSTTTPSYDVFLAYSGGSEETFTAEILNDRYEKLADAEIWHDYNNGYQRVNYTLSKFQETENIILKVTATSSLARGYQMYYDHTVILGYGVKSSVDTRLLNLESSDAPIILPAPNGNKYQLIVDNDGNISTKPFYFSKVLVLSHSFGNHGYAPTIGWYGTNWGMAAETMAQDYPHKLINLMKTVNPDVELVRVVNIAQFEQNHQNPDFNFSDYDYLNDLDFDCIIIKIGENAGNRYENMADHIIELVDNHVARNKNVTVFIASMFSYSTDTATSQSGNMNKEFYKVAQHYGTNFVMINKNGGPYGNTYNARLTPLPPKPDGTQPDKDTEVNSGVTDGHPGNGGMDMIAGEFWTSVKAKYGIL